MGRTNIQEKRKRITGLAGRSRVGQVVAMGRTNIQEKRKGVNGGYSQTPEIERKSHVMVCYVNMVIYSPACKQKRQSTKANKMQIQEKIADNVGFFKLLGMSVNLKEFILLNQIQIQLGHCHFYVDLSISSQIYYACYDLRTEEKSSARGLPDFPPQYYKT